MKKIQTISAFGEFMFMLFGGGHVSSYSKYVYLCSHLYRTQVVCIACLRDIKQHSAHTHWIKWPIKTDVKRKPVLGGEWLNGSRFQDDSFSDCIRAKGAKVNTDVLTQMR